jgi:hypothetical protein
MDSEVGAERTYDAIRCVLSNTPTVKPFHA